MKMLTSNRFYDFQLIKKYSEAIYVVDLNDMEVYNMFLH